MNKLFIAILLVLLSLPISVWAVDSNEALAQPTAVQDIESPVINTLDEDLENAKTEYKQPISKRKIAKKFLAAMGGVGVSSFLIFFLLTLYNRVREQVLNPVKTPDGETSLRTPDDINNAVKTFLEKTDWS